MLRNIAALLLSLSLTRIALAEGTTEDAAQLFRAGQAAYERGDYRAAAQAFEQAHAIVPRGPAAFSAARSWDHGNELARAAQAYELCLTFDDLASTERETAEARLAALRSELARIEVTAPAGAKLSVAHVRQRPIPFTVYLAPGDYYLEAEDDAGKRGQWIKAAKGETKKLSLEAPPPPVTRAPKPRAKPKPKAVSPPRASEPERESTSSSTAVWGWAALGMAAVSTGVGIYLGATGLAARDRFDDDGKRDADEHDVAVRNRLWANVAFGAALAFGITGGVLLVIDSSAEDGRTSGSFRLSTTF
jgi:tetratricopeptide (TPR) repeat protein